VRIEAGNKDARPVDPELAAHVGVQDAQCRFQRLGRDRRRHVLQRQVRRRQRDAQIAAGEHHHHLRRMRLFGKVFGVAGEGNAGIVDHCLVHWRRHHCRELAGLATFERSIEQSKNVRRIDRIELSCDGRHAQRHMDEIEDTRFRQCRRRPLAQTDGGTELRGTRTHHFPVGQNDEACCEILLREAQAEFGADAGRLARGDGDDRRHAQRSSSRRST
jgi:hypothetical protein